MASQGPNDGSSFINDASVGSVAFTSPLNARLSDTNYASVPLLLGQVSNFLVVTGFGFSVPKSSTIDGVKVEIQRLSSVTAALTDTSVYLTRNGAPIGINQAVGGLIPFIEAYTEYGSFTNNWGSLLTPADVNALDFGVMISVTAALAAVANINHVRMTVFYSRAENPPNTSRNFKSPLPVTQGVF